MIEYTAPLPAGTILANVRDAEYRAKQTAMPTPDLSYANEAVTELVWRYNVDPAPSAATLNAWRAAVADPTLPAAPWQNADTIDQRLAAAMAALQQIIDAADIAPGTLTAAQLSNAVRALQAAVKTEARALRRIIRHVRGDLTGSD